MQASRGNPSVAVRKTEPHPAEPHPAEPRPQDAGDMGAGRSVTALYELVPLSPGPLPDDSFSVRVRYKAPDSQQSVEAAWPGRGETASPSADFRFAAGVAEFGMLLGGSSHAGAATFASAIRLAEGALGNDVRRAEFVALVGKAAAIAQLATRALSASEAAASIDASR